MLKPHPVPVAAVPLQVQACLAAQKPLPLIQRLQLKNPLRRPTQLLLRKSQQLLQTQRLQLLIQPHRLTQLLLPKSQPPLPKKRQRLLKSLLLRLKRRQTSHWSKFGL